MDFEELKRVTMLKLKFSIYFNYKLKSCQHHLFWLFLLKMIKAFKVPLNLNMKAKCLLVGTARRVLIRLFSYYILLLGLFADRAMDYEIILALCGLSFHPTFMKCIL